MKRKLFLFIFFLLFYCFLFGQNKKTEDGLRVGKWVNKWNWQGKKLREFGVYKVVSIKNYDTIRELGECNFEIKHKNSRTLLFFLGRLEDKISVKDGIWQVVYPFGKVKEIDFWENGILQGVENI